MFSKGAQIPDHLLKMLVSTALIVAFGIPFVLQQDLWPFLRMGMFAQVAGNDLVTENFELTKNGTPFDLQAVGLAPASAQFMFRNAWYQHRAGVLLDSMATHNGNATDRWVLNHQINNKLVDSVVRPGFIPSSLP